MYKLISFDLDDTLSPAKSLADKEMLLLLEKLLQNYKVAIITGWKFETIKKQIINSLSGTTNFKNLYIYPTIGTRMYFYDKGKYILKYAEDLSDEEVNFIENILNKAIKNLNLKPKKVWGKIIENRWSQVTYSALWQEAPLEEKIKWDPEKKKRQKILEYIKNDLKNFSIWIGWTTSIDVTKKWLNKAYWINKMIENFWIKKSDILFIWDALYPGGNDYPVFEFWIDTIKVKNPEDTKNVIKDLLN